MSLFAGIYTSYLIINGNIISALNSTLNGCVSSFSSSSNVIVMGCILTLGALTYMFGKTDGKASYLLVPLATLIATIIAVLLITGKGSIMNGSGMQATLWSPFVALAVLGVMVISQKRMTFTTYLDEVFKGAGEMVGIAAMLMMTYALGTCVSTLDTGHYLASLFGSVLSPALLPVIIFLIGCVMSFATGTSTGTFNIMMLISIPMAQAITCADEWFEEGNVGGGIGMYCLGLKGGIGSASRRLTADGKDYTLGAFVMSNFGAAGNLIIGGKHYDTAIGTSSPENNKDRGSIIIVLATDLPLSERQLGRVAKRATVALGRTGSYCGNGSGDIAIAFTTANRIPHHSDHSILNYQMFYDEELDQVFEACVEVVEEAIISSLYHAETTTGVRGETAVGLKDFLASTADSSISAIQGSTL